MADGTHTEHLSNNDCGPACEGPHCLHLMEADTALFEGNPALRIFMALCGAEMARSDLPDSWCTEDCERELIYCTECMRVASERNAEAGSSASSRLMALIR